MHNLVYLNIRTSGTLQESRAILCAAGGEKEIVTVKLNEALARRGLPAVKEAKVGFKVEFPPYSFDVSIKQPRK